LSFLTKISSEILFSSMRATCQTQLLLLLLLLYLITLIIFGEEFKWRSSSLSSSLQPPVTSSWVQIFCSASWSQTSYKFVSFP
jgi:hypothetical protein